MSKVSKKPGEVEPRKIKNVELLPSIFATEPNKKMLDATLDLMTSKGQLLPFTETYGLRTASNKEEEFFKIENDEVRRESQANNMLVINDENKNYLGKVTYGDIENYFNIKGIPLKDGVILDKNISVLDIPVDPIKFVDYSLYYWLENGLPPCRIHLESAATLAVGSMTVGRKYSIYSIGDTNWQACGAAPFATFSATKVEDNVIEITNITSGKVYVGQQINGTNIQPGTILINQRSGTSGGPGLYVVDINLLGNLSGNYSTYQQGQEFICTATGTGAGMVTSKKFAINDSQHDNNLVGLPFATLRDDLTGRSLTLHTGMVVYFTGFTDQAYLTFDLGQPEAYYVYGVNDSIKLIKVSDIDKRIPGSTLDKRPWDKYGSVLDYTSTSWDTELWDSSERLISTVEYVVQDKFSSNTTHWQAIDNWYHISSIRAVAKFIDVDAKDFISSANKAVRPIISFNEKLKLYNWPQNTRFEIASFLEGTKESYEITGQSGSITDSYGYTLRHNDLVVFSNTNGVYRVNILTTPAPAVVFTTHVGFVNENDGAIIISNNSVSYHKVIFKGGNWQFAQNKVQKNQTPLFEFYTSTGTNLESFNEINYRGGVILGFKEGDIYDEVLDKFVDVTNIDFEIVSKSSRVNISPNQLIFDSDIDKEFVYFEALTDDRKIIRGPYAYKEDTVLVPFYQMRRGLDFTKQIQDLQYRELAESFWETEFIPPSAGFDTLHIYYDDIDKYKYYFEVKGYGKIRFSSRHTSEDIERIIPLVSGQQIKIVCHNLPEALTFYSAELTASNINTLVELEAPYATNNGITNGVITLDLRPSVPNLSTPSTTDFIDNPYFVSDTKLIAKLGDTLTTAYVNSENGWYFIQNIFVRDLTNPLYNDVDYSISDQNNEDGSLAFKKLIRETPNLLNRVNEGDKVCVASIVENPASKTAPAGLTINPLNENISSLNYYSLYQHFVSIKANSTNIKKFIDPQNVVPVTAVGGGTLLKHNNPLAKFAITATNLPFDLGEIIVKQGRHYDLFLNRLKTEIQFVIENNDYTVHSSLDLLSKALEQVYVVAASDNAFWSHSNMIGWGSVPGTYVQETITISPTNKIISFDNPNYQFENISFKAGKETILHIVYNNKVLMREQDYNFTYSYSGDQYTGIIFSDDFIAGGTKQVVVKQWFNNFRSMIPASLSKIGLAAIYKPEIYEDRSYGQPTYFICRHDGTRYLLVDGVDSFKYPVNIVDQLLYEYEKAVWSSIAYDVQYHDHDEEIEAVPGYFRSRPQTWNRARSTVEAAVRHWMAENNIFSSNNLDYDETNGFTLKYQVGSGDEDDTVIGSWRAIYKYIYDTDRPHSHPWEMLGYSLKPTWWDANYSWTDPTKRIALERALRIGLVSNPAAPAVVNPNFARLFDIDDPEEFPVTVTGDLLPPSALSWLNYVTFDSKEKWLVGDIGPFENIFLNTHAGLAAETRMKFLLAPAEFINTNWLPGQIAVNTWGNKVNKATMSWQQLGFDHDYHRKEVNGELVYTSGIESLLIEFCVLNNKDYELEVIKKFENVAVNKEFMLNGFTNKNSVKIQSTSVSSKTSNLFVPEENYQVRTIKHYPHNEFFYSAIRIIFDGSGYTINGYTSEYGYFPYFLPRGESKVEARTIGGVTVSEKTEYTTNIAYTGFGERYTNRQDIYDFLIGYGKYLESRGIIYDEVEGDDIRNWQLSAKQFIFWSNDKLTENNYIDLNPSAGGIKLRTFPGQLDNLEGTNENPGQCVDRFGNSLFSGDLLVYRDEIYTLIKAKNIASGIYGIKLTFSIHETVVHLEPTSVFGDIYFIPSQATTKRSFVVSGKKSQNWTGNFFAPGYVIDGSNLIPNFETMSEVGRNLLDVENVILDPTLLEASRSQFGLNRNPELRQLFLQEDNELLFKNSITFNKGTKQVFNSLQPLTHPDGSFTVPYEEYMVRTGEFGNTKNIEFYEFELLNQDLKQSAQLIKFTNDAATTPLIVYVPHTSSRWVYKPYGKDLAFTTTAIPTVDSNNANPILNGDTDYTIESLDNLPELYDQMIDLWSIPNYDPSVNYKKYDQVRVDGKLYYATNNVPPGNWGNAQYFAEISQEEIDAGVITINVTTNDQFDPTATYNTGDQVYTEGKFYRVKKSADVVNPGPWRENSLEFKEIDEPVLPNIFVNNYNKPDSQNTGTGTTKVLPGSWQILQTLDRELSIEESCPGDADTSMTRITTTVPHKLEKGDRVLIVNASDGVNTVNGIYAVEKLETIGDDRLRQFYIDVRSTGTIATGKVFVYKTSRFKTPDELIANVVTSTPSGGTLTDWKPKFNPLPNKLNEVNPPVDNISPINVNNTIQLPLTPSGFDRTKPIAVAGSTVYQISNVNNQVSVEVVKQPSYIVETDDIEHLLVYDYFANKTLVKPELFDPKNMKLPKAFIDEIDVTGRVDPARYSRTTDTYKSVYIGLAWYEEYVGRRWWDTSTIKFADYSNGDDFTKAKFWGATVNNSKPDIYEWTRSPVHPSQWEKLVEQKKVVFGELASGQPYVDKSLGTDNYHWVEETDYVNGNAYTVYYFWVKNKKTISEGNSYTRIYTVDQLSKVLLNPDAAGLAWWAPISNNTIVVKGIENYLNNHTVVQIKKKTKGEEKHQQWLFVSEGNTVETIPEWLHIRFRDSIAGHLFYTGTVDFTVYSPTAVYKQSDFVKFGDNFYVCRVYMTAPAGAFNSNLWEPITDVTQISPSQFTFTITRNVPDYANLHRYNLYGNVVRPYVQTWFKDLYEARRTFIKKCNEILLNVDVTSLPAWGDTILNKTNYLNGSDLVNMTEYWYYTDFRSEDYDSSKSIAAATDNIEDLYSIGISTGDYIRVNSGPTEYTIYRKNDDNSFTVVYRKNGAIQFFGDLYEKAVAWDADRWEAASVPWDYSINSVLDAIVNSLRREIFVGNYLKYYSSIICAMFRYVLSEQVNVDWLVKSSTIEPVNLIGQTLSSNDFLKRDEVTTLVSFYSSVKSYRDKIRSSTINKVLSELTVMEISESFEITTADPPVVDVEGAGSSSSIPISLGSSV